MRNRIVLDTNCLIASLSRSGEYYSVWKGLQEGKYILCVSNDIILEYQEIIGLKATPFIAENVIQFLINSKFVEHYEPKRRYNLITTDPDDNKFTDCAIASNAICIVSNDHHFNETRGKIPHIDVMSLANFVKWLFPNSNQK